MGKRLENICESLTELLQKGKRIDEEQVHVFFESAADYLNGGEDEKKVAKLDKLTAYLQKKWQYREIESMNSDQAFLCGSIWGATRLLSMKRERKEKAFRLEELRKQYTGHYDFLHTIAENPGIKHKDLAKKCDRSVSSLSQFAAGVKKDGLILCRRIGRETYYYLRPLGEQVYEHLRQEELEKQKVLILLQEKRLREERSQQRSIKELLEWPNIFHEGRNGDLKPFCEIVTENSNYDKPIEMGRIDVEDNYESMVTI